MIKRSRFSKEQIIGILKVHQVGLSAARFCRRHGISDGMLCKLRLRYSGLDLPCLRGDPARFQDLQMHFARPDCPSSG